MKREYTDKDGFTFRVFNTMYVDWGLAISKGGEDVYYCPSALCREVYGFKPPEGMEYEEALEADALVEWSEADWRECLESEADSLVEALVDPVHWMSPEDHEAHLKALA